MSLDWHRFPHLCNTNQYAWCFEGLRLILARACWHVPYTQVWKPIDALRETLPDFRRENEPPPLPYYHSEILVRIVFCVLWRTWGKALLDFRFENKAKCCRIFSMEIWQWFQTHLGSIDQDHTLSESKLQSPICLKPQKLIPITCFQLPMSLNYDFTKTKDYLWTSIVGCLTPSPHVTRLSNSRIKIFYPSTLD